MKNASLVPEKTPRRHDRILQPSRSSKTPVEASATLRNTGMQRLARTQEVTSLNHRKGLGNPAGATLHSNGSCISVVTLTPVLGQTISDSSDASVVPEKRTILSRGRNGNGGCSRTQKYIPLYLGEPMQNENLDRRD